MESEEEFLRRLRREQFAPRWVTETEARDAAVAVYRRLRRRGATPREAAAIADAEKRFALVLEMEEQADEDS